MFMVKNYSDNLHSVKNTGENLTSKKMFEISDQLILEHSDEIFGASQISWEDSPWRQFLMQRFILRFCVVSWKGQSEPKIKYCLGTTVGMVERFITIQNTGHNRRRTDGIRVKYFPRILNIGACPRSPKVHEQNGRTRTIPRTNYLHVDVQ